ncbi:2220_t:CDS:2 [Diversispora eburnea]|uniref:2220_t:CDS:1 n=1 Tax=Diversispora eburnea TaxID=1213867 RepID=A0A9N9C087_9GLOM|nr:2220_t:CDS:2 [Diversispora eburnea]
MKSALSENISAMNDSNAAESDHIIVQYMIGECFYEGSGTEKDILKTIDWLN